MVPMSLARIIISETTENQIIVLKETDGERQFPIVIGIYEATAIDRGLKEIRAPRPLTHDLICSILNSLEAELERVVVCDLRGSTFYAKMLFRRDGEILEVDSRPSDAIAVATILGVPIYVEEKVIEQVAQTE